ncbi:MAG: carboxypeptidase regulatory-like domain-containing protein [Myxococcales bacterium]|nr:carboxypeptidase regulatory-like domain-containing protein [Myxococcales bacterium]
MRIGVAALTWFLIGPVVSSGWARPRRVDPVGSLDITVVDTIALPHAGAQVTLDGPALVAPRVGVSDDEGRVHFGELTGGLYTVTASLDGFSAETWPAVRVPGAFQRSIRVVLAPGAPIDGTGVGARAAVLRELRYCRSDPDSKDTLFNGEFVDHYCDALEMIGCTTPAGGTSYVLRAGNVIAIRSWTRTGGDTHWGDAGALAAITECLSRTP